MTKQDKQLLLADLCARLPYKVIVETQLANAPRAEHPVLKVLQSHMLCDFMQTIDNVIHKPYLRPMTSMTLEERKEYAKLLFADLGGVNEDYYKSLDYLHSIHVDYRGLIEKGLAIEAPEGMYNNKEEQQ